MRSGEASPITAVAAVVVCLALVALARTARREPTGPPVALAAAPAVVPAGPDAGPPESEAARALREGRPVDLNRASEDDLRLLPRIGPALASRIAASRRQEGPFRSVDDLRRVRGIGPRTLDRLRPLLTVQPPDAGP